jgi:MFS family permease
MSVSMLLLPPTALMGATLPLLSQAVAGNSELLGRPVGALYAVNTGGAVVGAVIAGYGLLPALGNRMTLASAVAANLALGLVVLGYGFLHGAETRTDQAPITRRHPKPSTRRLPAGAGLTVIALGVSGGVTMIYEVAWTRALALVIGSSTYAFTAMLVALLVGIAGGSALYAWLLGPKPGSPTIFGALQAAVGLTGVAALALYERMPARFAQSAALNTDDRLRLEFAAPGALYADTRENLALIRSFRHAGPPFLAGVAGLDQPEAQYWIGMTYLNRGSLSDAIVRFQRALARDPSYTPAMRAIALARTTAADRASRQARPAHR